MQAINEDIQALGSYLDCPYTLFPSFVDDDELIAAYRAAQVAGKHEGYTPVMVVVDEDAILRDSFEIALEDAMEEEEGIATMADFRRQVLAIAETLDGQAVLEKRLDEIQANVDAADWASLFAEDDDDVDSFRQFISYWRSDGSAESLPVLLAKVPTDKPWELPVWVPMGGYNDCPTPAEQVAVAKYWYDTYGVSPAVVSYDTWEFDVPTLPAAEVVDQLAKEQFGFCSDIVEQSAVLTTIPLLAKCLVNSPMWYFWWD